jgi:hypothetical protein
MDSNKTGKETYVTCISFLKYREKWFQNQINFDYKGHQ